MISFIATILGKALDSLLAPFLAYLKGKADAESKYQKQELRKIKKELNRLSKRPHTRADTHELLDKWARIIESSTDTTKR